MDKKTAETASAATGASLSDVMAISNAENYLLQRQERWEKHVSELLRSVDLLAREEEAAADVNDGVIHSIETLKQLNTALATAAKRQRDQDANQMKQTQTSLELQLNTALEKAADKDKEIQELRRKISAMDETNGSLQNDIVGLRSRVRTLEKTEVSLRDDLSAEKSRAVAAEKKVEQLSNEIVSIRLEKDSVTQRFLQLTRNLSAVAEGHSSMLGESTSQDHERSSTVKKQNARFGVEDRRNVGRRRRKKNDTLRWDVAQVRTWLEANGFKEYANNFSKNSVDGEMLLDLTNDDLKSLLGMKDPSQREAFMCLRDAL